MTKGDLLLVAVNDERTCASCMELNYGRLVPNDASALAHTLHLHVQKCTAPDGCRCVVKERE